MSLSPAVSKLFAGLSADIHRQATDAELLGQYTAAKDELAFAVLVNRHSPRVLGVCRWVLGHVQDAEDAAQAVFIVLARHAHRVRNPSVLTAWLHGVAVRVARKALARRRGAMPLTDEVTTIAPSDKSWSDVRQVIDEALAALPDSLGPEAKFLVWIVLDGTTHYVDLNGSGDLTEGGKKFENKTVQKGSDGKIQGNIFVGIELTEPTGVWITSSQRLQFLLGSRQD